MTSNTFCSFEGKTVTGLQQWLETRGVSTKGYGQASTKSLSGLLGEVEKGETALLLDGDTPLRVVNVLNVHVTNSKGQVLMEERQVLPGGRSRARGLPLAEKLLPGEGWRAGVARAVAEELGSLLPQPPQVVIHDHTYSKDEETQESSSYPGLLTKYCCHRVVAEVAGLPDSERFVTTEQRPEGVLENHWRWMSPE